jgi:hypothetical protein
MCLTGRVLLIGSYVPFCKDVDGRQFCVFQVEVCW